MFALMSCVTFQQMIRGEGSLSMYRGFGAHIQRSCVYNGIMFLIFEKLMAISSYDTNQKQNGDANRTSPK